MPGSFLEKLVESFEARPRAVAMRIVGSDDATYTFGEMLLQIRSVAHRLEIEGVKRGDRVALIGENHPKWAIAYLGTLYRGAVIVPLDPHGEIATITNFLLNSEAKVAFLSPDQIERFETITAGLSHEIKAVAWSETAAPGGELANPRPGSFDDWATGNLPADVSQGPAPTSSDDIAVLMYTSGTTGTPKGVPLTHGNIFAELEGVNRVLHLSDKEKILSLLPLFHAYLQIVNLWIATTYGCEVGYLKELTPAELSSAIREFKPTILTTVPRLWYVFHKKIFDAVGAKSGTVQKLFRTLLSLNGVLRNTMGINLGPKFFREIHEGFGGRLHIAISAGSRFDEDVALDFHKLGFTILQGYGLTETSGAATATHIDDNRVGSVGTPMHGAEIKIDSPNSEGIGEVLIRGDIVFAGYYKNPEATAEAFTDDGWFRSGDLGKLADGHLYIVGRAKDVIVLPSGKNVHPEDLEVHYLKCPLVAELAIVGVEDDADTRAGSEKLAAIVVPDFDYLKREKIANSKEAIRHALDTLGRQLPEYQRVRDYIIRAEPLPRTATRKIKRFQLKQELESGAITRELPEQKAYEMSAADAALLESPVARTVVTAIERQRPARLETPQNGFHIHPSMNLEIDLGLDSLARAEMFATLEQAFSTEFEGEDAATALTVANVVDLVNKHGGASTNGGSLDLNWAKIVREAEDDIPEIRYVLRDRPVFAAFAWSVYKLFNFFCRVFMRLEVSGLDNLPKPVPRTAGGEPGDAKIFLVCPNHQSFLDPFVLCSNYPYGIFKRTFHVGASEFFTNRLMRSIARMLNVVPVDPDTQLMRAMKAGAIGLKHGRILNIYPEGERAFDGRLHSFKNGAAILATELDLPIVPVAIDGLYKVWPRASWRIRPAKVKIRIGEPFYAKDVVKAEPPASAGGFLEPGENGNPPVNAGGSASDDDAYSRVTAHLKNTISTMIDEMRSS